MYLTEIRSGSLMFVLCFVGVWQRNFEPVVCVCVCVCVCTVRPSGTARRTVHTHHWFKITLPNTDEAQDKHQ